MCRPIESRDSLGVMGPAALFAAYQPSGNPKTLPTVTANASAKGVANMCGGNMNNPMWAIDPSSANMNNFGTTNDGMNMLSMAAQPPALPFVCFPKNTSALPSMPWSNVAANESLNYGLNMEQALEEEMKPAALPVSSPFTLPRRNANEDFEAAELEELLDFSMPDDLACLEKDKEELINLDDGFDGTEMSILYSFLVDAPEEKVLVKKPMPYDSDDGILNLNMLTSTPIESLMESLDEDFTDEELKMTPPPSMEQSETMYMGMPEVKSRRLCRAEDCYKRSRSNGMCISHGGGRRCAVDGCDKSSQGGNLCIRHGGGKRCSYDDCDKAAQSNFLCKAHGGGPRCQIDGCERSSQGGGYCRSHGGGKRCMFDGCQKGTQRGDYCALHGGSRLCEIPGCMRNDRGGGLCATHGGGKRCSVENCIKPCRRKGFCSAHLRQMEGTK